MANKKLKMALISGASHALRFQKEHPRLSEEDIIQRISREANQILSKLDTEE
ncbi:hypothetical protein HYZ97_02060 [Candidatus Pacearchaeota archaeon]|nr:hypothetical protein [Candidatus Pacearchaeota archaeon]